MISSIAIGAFDGVHLAHKVLIDSVDAVVIIERNSGVLTPGYLRTKHTSKPSFFYHLDKIKDLCAEDFVAKLKADFPSLAKIVVGYDFHFGKDKIGDTKLLKKLFDGEVIVIDTVKSEGIPVHSRVIKDALRAGDIKTANKLLGREYEITAQSISGQGLGARELVPTLNLSINDFLLPKEGVYATRTKIDGYWYDSVSFIGHRVSADCNFAIETHILDRDIGIIRDDISISFVAFLRDNQKFNRLEELKTQIVQDIKEAKRIL
ncbi:MAG: bifunctional riboflavin kinase/FAD synthetase [Sulfurovaceae bacterium]|nr:bifunctional riboflavin kinase/FAD synthetase [Sulfurovaceae bacterium]